MKPFTAFAVALFALIAVAHVLRLIFSWEVVVAGFVIPVWWSFAGFLIAGGLALMLWRESHASARL